MAERILGITDFSRSFLESVLKGVLAEMGVKPGILMNAVRTAVTGQPKGPEFFEFMMAIGKEKVARRLRHAAEWFHIPPE